MKSIVLLTSGQPSLNPRLIKEADTLSDSGYKVTVVYQYWNDWATTLDEQLLAQKKWTAIRIGGTPIENKYIYYSSRLSYKLARILIKRLGFSTLLANYAIGRCTPMLIKKVKSMPADLYIAHNLAALPAAVIAAKANRSKCGFDAEDFHRNEVSNDPLDFDVKLKTSIENQYLDQLDYFSTASPLISKAYKDLYPSLNPATILNVFTKQRLKPKKGSSESLRLFWFSQTIGAHRGLEHIIALMGQLNKLKIELHLLGNYDTTTKAYFSKIALEAKLNEGQIFYYLPIPADDIFSFASQFDIGLATEIDFPKNRDICLTNKIFTYIQSGLAIVASATSAQKQLMMAYPDMGVIYEQEQLSSQLLNYIQNPTLLKEHRENAINYANTILNWETEKKKFLAIVQQTLNSN